MIKHARMLALLMACVVLILVGCSSTPPGTPSDSNVSEPNVSDTTKEPTKKEITITIDNWDTYFEFVEKEEEFKNDYNETVHIQHYYTFDLKDEYSLVEVDLNIDYSYLATCYEVQEDLINKKIIWGDIIEGPTEETVEKEVRYDECPVAGEWFFITGDQKWKNTDFKVNRIYGKLVIIE